MVKNFLFNTNDIKRSAYIWNTASGLLSAAQSVFLLIIVGRIAGIVAAGIFSISWAKAHQALSVGRYGMRNFQVTDTSEYYTMGEYFSSRVITTLIMIVICVAYIIYGRLSLNYSAYKCWAMLFICATKSVDSVSDVIAGRFQQKMRLDIAAKIEVIVLVFSMSMFITGLIITRQLLLSVSLWFVCTLLSNCILWYIALNNFETIESIRFTQKVLMLLYECLPLCAGSFLINYIGNAPKYAIDAYLTEEIQAYYNYIFMPVFAVGLMANLVFNPILVEMGENWNSHSLKKFQNMIYKQVLVIIAITVFAIVFAYAFGTPILSFIYDVDLDKYKLELCILMLGGGFLALATFFGIVITTMRNQKFLLICYIFTALLAKMLSKMMVKCFGIKGAVLLYVGIMTILVFMLLLIILYGIKKERIKYRLE